MRRFGIVLIVLCSALVSAQTVIGGAGAGVTRWYGVSGGAPPSGTGVDAYCPPGAGSEKTHGAPSWPSSIGPALTPTNCINTAIASTPSGTHIGGGAGVTHTPANATALNTVLGILQCGDTIQLAQGGSYIGTFTFPALGCDGAHWIIVRTSAYVSEASKDANFPSYGNDVTPCASGYGNNGANGRSHPGYPDWSCPNFPTALTSQLRAGASNSTPAISLASGANHYRFIGVEFTKNPLSYLGTLIQLVADNGTLGAHDIIFDRCVIHGKPWTVTSTNTDSTNNGISAGGSQWISLINSWDYDTFCITSCIDSSAFSAGTNINQDGPFKIYGGLLASAGETWIFGGGGKGAGMPNTKDVEIRFLWSFKPLVWMVPIEYCGIYNNVVPKNLGEFKNMTYFIGEAIIFENSWQGCQSDQIGYGVLLNPGSQNNHQNMTVNYDGSAVVVSADGIKSFSHDNGTPDDPTNCPPAGCVLEDVSVTGVVTVRRFCAHDGSNGCDQSGIPGRKCGGIGASCSSDATCGGLLCSPAMTARLTAAVPTNSNREVNSCVPGDCPACRVENITYRNIEIFNVTNGIEINTGLSSHCHDEASGMQNVALDNFFIHGMSTEMSNGSDPYNSSEVVNITSNIEGNVGHNFELSHFTVGIETGNPLGGGGVGSQNDHTNRKYLRGINFHDWIVPEPYVITKSSGSVVTSGVGGAFGLINTYQTDACNVYYPTQASTGFIVSETQNFTFIGFSGVSYFVTVNGQYRALQAGFTTSAFSLQIAASIGDTITIRNLQDCDWKFDGMILGSGIPGAGKPNDPYYTNPNACGITGTSPCLLNGTDFTSLFQNWGTGRGILADFVLTSATYINSATDAATRPVTGKSPGVDTTVVAAALAGVRSGTVFVPTLLVSTGTLSPATVGTPYQAALAATGGASPFKAWFLETDPTNCGGSCGTLPAGIVIGRSGVVNGPFVITTVSLKNNKAKFVIQQRIVAGADSWTPGQLVAPAGFCIDGSNPCVDPANSLDGDLNGTWAVVADSTDCTNTITTVCLAITHADIPNHAPLKKGTNNPVVTFAPTTSGTFDWWMGTHDGAFNESRASIHLVIAP